MEPLLLDAWVTRGKLGEEVGEVAGGGWDSRKQTCAHRHLLGHRPGCTSMHRDSCDGARCSAVDAVIAGNAAVGAALRDVTTHDKRTKRSERLPPQRTAATSLQTCDAIATATKRLNWRNPRCAHARGAPERREVLSRKTGRGQRQRRQRFWPWQQMHGPGTGVACRRRGLARGSSPASIPERTRCR